jgi:phosphatidate cytidylyltransferase
MLKQRTITALVLALLGILLVRLSPTIMVALITGLAVVVASLWEWTRLAGLAARPLRSAIVALVAIALVPLWLLRDTPEVWWVIGAGVIWWLLAGWWLANVSFGAAPTRENAAVKLVAGLFATLPAWLALIKLHEDPHRGPGWTLFALTLVSVADIAAYFTGSRYGRKKLCPQISPNKTVAGVYGALGATILLAIVGGWILGARGLAWLAFVALALVTVAFSIVGDLFESLIKRQAGVKDSGTLFPGHGGLFDRFDSVFAALPVFAIGKALLDLAFAP